MEGREQKTAVQEIGTQETEMQKIAVQEAEAQKKDEKDIGGPNPAYGDCLLALKRRLEQTDAVVIEAGSGLSAAASPTHADRWLEDHFREFVKRYGMRDMHLAGFYPFSIQEGKWAYWGRYIYYNRYDTPVAKLYRDLYAMMKDKNYFVLIINVDHQFWLAGFQDECIFVTQGDYGLFQCKQTCHKRPYNNEAQIRAVLREQKDCRISPCQVPKCPVCGGDVEVHLRYDGNSVEDKA